MALGREIPREIGPARGKNRRFSVFLFRSLMAPKSILCGIGIKSQLPHRSPGKAGLAAREGPNFENWPHLPGKLDANRRKLDANPGIFPGIWRQRRGFIREIPRGASRTAARRRRIAARFPGNWIRARAKSPCLRPIPIGVGINPPPRRPGTARLEAREGPNLANRPHRPEEFQFPGRIQGS